MRVLLTTDTIGGVWTYCKELTEGLLERAHSVALVSFGRLPNADQAAWCSRICDRFSSAFEYTASDKPLEWMDENCEAYSGGEDLLLRKVRSFYPDLLHTNQFCFGKLPTSLPRLVTAHSDVLSWAKACRPNGLEPSPWLERYKEQVQAGLNSANAVVAPTRWMLEALAQHFTLLAEGHVIPNGRDLLAVPGVQLKRLQAVTAGRFWDEAKGLSVLNQISSTLPIYVAGDTQRVVEGVPTDSSKIYQMGYLPEHILFELFSSSSIYLALSKYEPFGLAPLEAALCGCAILARDIPSFREVWGSDALYFSDAAGLEQCLERLGSDPPALSILQDHASTRARKLSRSRMTESYLDLYGQLIGSATCLSQSSRNRCHSLEF